MDIMTPIKYFFIFLGVVTAIHFALYMWTCSITTAYYRTVKKMFKSEVEKASTEQYSKGSGGCDCG